MTIHFTVIILILQKTGPRSNTSHQVTTMLRRRVGTRGNSGLQDPLNRPAGNDGVCPSALCLYILCLDTRHRALYTGLDFLNVESSLIVFCMHLGVWAHAYPLRNDLESEFIHHHHRRPRAPLKLLSSWPLPGNPILQANTSLFSVTIDQYALSRLPYTLLFLIWLLSLGIMILRFIHGVMCIGGSFLGIFLEFL